MKHIAFMLTVAVITIVGCTKGRQPQETRPTPLISGVTSRQSSEQFTNYLRGLNLRWEITKQSSLSPTDRRPPFTIYEITVSNYPYLNSRGDLTALFFNNRLAEIHFYPMTMPPFLQKLATNGVVLGSNDQKKTMPPTTEIWLGKDEHGKEFVGWRDSTLVQEMNDWVREYA